MFQTSVLASPRKHRAGRWVDLQRLLMRHCCTLLASPLPGYWAVQPPSTISEVPVTKLDASDARNTAAPDQLAGFAEAAKRSRVDDALTHLLARAAG